MTTTRRLAVSASTVAALLFAAWQIPLAAKGPSIVMIYGAPLDTPVHVVMRDAATQMTYRFLNCGSHVGTPRDEGDRRFLKLAMFWGLAADVQREDVAWIEALAPEAANQHGRLYLPADGRPASIAVTGLAPVLARVPDEADQGRIPAVTFAPLTLPEATSDFVGACQLTPAEVDLARALGVPGLGVQEQ